MPDEELLEARLRRLGSALEYPATPDLRSAVERRINSRRINRIPRLWPLAVAAAVLVGAVLTAATVPPVREAVAGWINFGRVRVERVDQLPSPTPTRPGQLHSDLHLGEPVSLADARARLGQPLLVPASLGQPDGAYWQAVSHSVSLLYLTRADLPETAGGVAVLVMEAPGSIEYPILNKVVGPGTRLEEVSVRGVRGGWLEGAPHAVVYLDPSGRFVTDDVRLARNVLIWSAGGVTYRIESALPRDRVLAIAESMR